MDKYRDALLNIPQFAVGEQPSALKLNRSFSVIREAFNIIEEGIGDITLSNPSNTGLDKRPLLSVSLGRLVGPSDALSVPCPVDSVYDFTVSLSAGFNEWVLPVVPHDGTARALTVVLDSNAPAKGSSGDLLFQTEKSAGQALAAPGDWKFLPEENKIVSFSHLDTGTVTITGKTFLNASKKLTKLPNFSIVGSEVPVIQPPLNIQSPSSISVSTSSDPLYDYLVTLGTEAVKQRSPIVDSSDNQLDETGLSAASGLDQSLKGAPLFASATSNAQMRLPYLLDSILNPGDEIPRSIVLLYDDTASQLYVDATYYYKDSTSFYIKGPSLTTTNSFRVVCNTATHVSTLLEALRFELRNHSHIGPNSISHRTLDNLGYGAGQNLLPSEVTSDLGLGLNRSTIKSSFKGNEHPQYLMRYGLLYGLDPENNNGLMEGPLAIGNKPTDARTAAFSDFWGAVGKESFPLTFGGQAELRLMAIASGESPSTTNLLSFSGKAFGWNSTIGSTNIGLFSSESNLDIRAILSDTILVGIGTNLQFGDNSLGNLASDFLKSSLSITGDFSSITGGVTHSDVRVTGSQASASLSNVSKSKVSLTGDGVSLSLATASNSEVNTSGSSASFTSSNISDSKVSMRSVNHPLKVDQVSNADVLVSKPSTKFATDDGVTYGPAGEFEVKDGDIYRRGRDVRLDSEEKILRIPIIKSRAVYMDPVADASGFKNVYAPTFTWSDNGSVRQWHTVKPVEAVSDVDLVYDMDIPSNCAIKKIHLAFFHPTIAAGGNLNFKVLEQNIDGLESGTPLFTKTLVAAKNGTEVEVVDLILDSSLPGLKINGSRYPLESLYMASLIISNSVNLIGGWIEYRVMRF